LHKTSHGRAEQFDRVSFGDDNRGQRPVIAPSTRTSPPRKVQEFALLNDKTANDTIEGGTVRALHAWHDTSSTIFGGLFFRGQTYSECGTGAAEIAVQLVEAYFDRSITRV
jgi:hypothetical protein